MTHDNKCRQTLAIKVFAAAAVTSVTSLLNPGNAEIIVVGDFCYFEKNKVDFLRWLDIHLKT